MRSAPRSVTDEETGADFLSFRLEIDVNRYGPAKALWHSYTPNTGHTSGHDTPQGALAATVFASTEPAKLLALAAVHGKEHSAGPACRKRLERERSALRAVGARQFHLVLQTRLPLD